MEQLYIAQRVDGGGATDYDTAALKRSLEGGRYPVEDILRDLDSGKTVMITRTMGGRVLIVKVNSYKADEP